jgi:hypothetical protein
MFSFVSLILARSAQRLPFIRGLLYRSDLCRNILRNIMHAKQDIVREEYVHMKILYLCQKIPGF